jgi:hypothetical protein
MKTRSQLPKYFRRLFALLEILAMVGAAIVCALILGLPRISDHAKLGFVVGLVPESGALTVQVGDSKAESISINNLQGTLLVNSLGDGNGLLALTRWYTLPLVIAYAAYIAVLFDLLRRLFRNVERGESFTERSVHLVHKIGMTIILFTLLSAMAAWWHNRSIITYLQQHGTIEGVKMTFKAPSANSIIVLRSDEFDIPISWGGILTGLLILSLGEVFRQGLALKQDNELTI